MMDPLVMYALFLALRVELEEWHKHRPARKPHEYRPSLKERFIARTNGLFLRPVSMFWQGIARLRR